jgi:hypothetical protein
MWVKDLAKWSDQALTIVCLVKLKNVKIEQASEYWNVLIINQEELCSITAWQQM